MFRHAVLTFGLLLLPVDTTLAQAECCLRGPACGGDRCPRSFDSPPPVRRESLVYGARGQRSITIAPQLGPNGYGLAVNLGF